MCSRSKLPLKWPTLAAGCIASLAFAWIPAMSFAACSSDGKRSYDDITAIYFLASGITKPVIIDPDRTLTAGECPGDYIVTSTLSEVEMDKNGIACAKDAAGNGYTFGGIYSLHTEDAPQTVFERLNTVLLADGFYDLARATPDDQSSAKQRQARILYQVAVVQCAIPPDLRPISEFRNPPQQSSNTTILSITVPIAVEPGTKYNGTTLKLFNDVVTAIYQSKWLGDDIY